MSPKGGNSKCVSDLVGAKKKESGDLMFHRNLNVLIMYEAKLKEKGEEFSGSSSGYNDCVGDRT